MGYSFVSSSSSSSSSSFGVLDELLRFVLLHLFLVLFPYLKSHGSSVFCSPSSASASSSSSSSTPPPSTSSPQVVHLRKYGVFLSFRGADTRDTFVSHLYDSLCRQGIPTFIDNEDLDRGKPISVILEAISQSNIAIVVFSKNYASSSFCLDELEEIMECKRTKGLEVVPVFYQVDPDDVARQSGPFRDAFAKHGKELTGREGKAKMQRWRTAMTAAANLAGWDSRNVRPESALIHGIVSRISTKLCYLYSGTLKKSLVGMEKRIEQVESLLCILSNETRVVGMWGMGGTGKTTLAESVFQRNSPNFQGSCCFISSVREESERRGLQQLQRDLLKDLFHEGKVSFNQLRHRKVFVVLDDVADYNQFEFLVGSRDWVGKGSKIIVTSRDRHLLVNIAGHGSIFDVPALYGHEARQLFSMFAFQRANPMTGYAELSYKFVSYANGNPLALKVLGLYLHDKSEQEWKSALRKLERTINKDILAVLRISFDGLDDEQQKIFLHVACFLKGYPESLVEEILDACDFCYSDGIRVLLDKALIMRSNGKIHMHDLLQEMGREIVRQENTDDPGKRSRLWNPNDIRRVLIENAGTNAVKGIFLDMLATDKLSLGPAAFSNMNRLELLKFHGSFDQYDDFFPEYLESKFQEIQLPHGLESIPSSLRYLYWECYPLNSLPPNFCAENLVIIDMPCSKVEHLWTGKQNLVNLKEIRLQRCRNLIEMPDLSSAHNLVTINCRYCGSLLEVPPSVSFLEKLEVLDFRSCTKIESVPSLRHVRSLKNLDLGRCPALSTFPEVSVTVERLTLTGTAIEEVPESIKSLSQLQHLDLMDCERLRNLPAGFCELKSLEVLFIGPMINVENLNNAFSSLSSLTQLCLFKGSFEALPTSVAQLSRLEQLQLQGCTRLRSLPNLPPCLQSIIASYCISLETVPRLSFQVAEGWERRPLYFFNFSNCIRLDHDSCGNILNQGRQAILHLANAVSRHPDRERLRRRAEVLFVCPGSEIPQWFTTQQSGSVINIDLPLGWHNENFLGFSFCAVIEQPQEINAHKLRIRWKCQLGSNDVSSGAAYETFDPCLYNLELEHVFMFYSSYFHRIFITDSRDQWFGNYYDRASFEVFTEDYCESSCYVVKSCAVRLLYAGDNEDHDHSVV